MLGTYIIGFRDLAKNVPLQRYLIGAVSIYRDRNKDVRVYPYGKLKIGEIRQIRLGRLEGT